MRLRKRVPTAVLGLVILVAACGDGAEDLTSPSTAPETASWSEVVVDSQAATGQIPTVVAGPDGQVGIVYLREVQPDFVQLMWSSCVDPQCTDMNHAVLGSGPLWLAWGRSAFLTAEGVVVSGYARAEDGTDSAVLWTCQDASCQEPIQTILGGSTLGVQAIPGHMPLIGVAEWSEESSFEMTIGYCEDWECSSRRSVPIHEGRVGFGSPSLRLLPDGTPVLFFTTGGQPGTDGQWVVAACTDPECSDMSLQTQDSSWSTQSSEFGLGLPSIVYLAGHEIHQLQCADAACSAVSDRLLHVISDVLVGSVAATAIDDSLFVLYESLVDVPADFTDWELSLLRCDADDCRPMNDVPFTRGSHISIGHSGENTLLVAVQSGRPFLCLDECVEPTQDLSSLTLFFHDLADR